MSHNHGRFFGLPPRPRGREKRFQPATRSIWMREQGVASAIPRGDGKRWSETQSSPPRSLSTAFNRPSFDPKGKISGRARVKSG